MRALVLLALLLAGSVSAAPPNLALAWTGTASGAEFMRLQCNGINTDNVTSPTQLTDASGNYVLAGAADGIACVLVGVNAFGQGPSGGQLVMGIPGAGPVLTVITQ